MKLYQVLLKKNGGDWIYLLADDCGEVLQWVAEVHPDKEIITISKAADYVVNTAETEALCQTPTE